MATVILLRRNRIILTIPNKEKLNTPNNIEVDGSNVSFEGDERATQFEFVVNGTSWGDYSSNQGGN